jgi:hypothetical protein
MLSGSRAADYNDMRNAASGNQEFSRLGGKVALMSLNYAVDRLYEVGWLFDNGIDVERLSDGRRYPTIDAIARLFGENGLQLSIKGSTKFRCFQATWSPVGEEFDPNRSTDERHGTVIGACDREAAVYALAQHLASQKEPVELAVS